MPDTKKYTHQPLGEEVCAIAGAYTLEKEIRLRHAGREVLVVLGCATIDSSCCGTGGCRYAFVPGYVINWRDQFAEDGLPVSSVEPVREPRERRAIELAIRERELLSSVEFW